MIQRHRKGKEMDNFLDQTEQLLQDTKFFIKPISWVFDQLLEENPKLQITQDEFIQIIQGDSRFRLFDAPKVELTDHMKALISREDLERMGFYRGPRIMLKNRVPSRKEMVLFLLDKADQTFETLKKAWDIKPDGDEEIEDQLLTALAKSQKLQRELKQFLDIEDKKDIKNDSGSELKD